MAKNGKLIDDPELRAWLPPIEPEELTQLKLNIQRDGCRDPILHWQGKIIDGFNRYDLCEELGLGYQTRELKFDCIQDVKLWMIENQGGRRNWTDQQRAHAVASAMNLKASPEGRPIVARRTLENKGSETGEFPQLTISEASKQTGIDRSTLGKAAAVVADGASEVNEAVASGKLDLKKAATIAKLPKKKQAAAVKKATEPKPKNKPVSTEDELGNEIADDMKEVFAARDAFDKARNMIIQVTKTLNPLLGSPKENRSPAPGGFFISKEQQKFVASLQKLAYEIGYYRPYCACPKHNMKGKCLICGGAGFVTEDIYKHSGVK